MEFGVLVERLFHKKGEPIIIQNLTVNICPECNQESLPLKSARIIEDILNEKIKPTGEISAKMYRAAQRQEGVTHYHHLV